MSIRLCNGPPVRALCGSQCSIRDAGQCFTCHIQPLRPKHARLWPLLPCANESKNSSCRSTRYIEQHACSHAGLGPRAVSVAPNMQPCAACCAAAVTSSSIMKVAQAMPTPLQLQVCSLAQSRTCGGPSMREVHYSQIVALLAVCIRPKHCGHIVWRASLGVNDTDAAGVLVRLRCCRSVTMRHGQQSLQRYRQIQYCEVLRGQRAT